MLRYTTLSATSLAMALALVACSSDKSHDASQVDDSQAHDSASSMQSMQSESPPHSSNAAVKAYVDPTTGALRDPTSVELAAEAAVNKRGNATATPQQDKKPVEIIRSDGSVEVLLDPSSAHPLQGCLQKDGTVKMDHDCNPDVNVTK